MRNNFILCSVVLGVWDILKVENRVCEILIEFMAEFFLRDSLLRFEMVGRNLGQLAKIETDFGNVGKGPEVWHSVGVIENL